MDEIFGLEDKKGGLLNGGGIAVGGANLAKLLRLSEEFVEKKGDRGDQKKVIWVIRESQARPGNSPI